jgi:diaminohydroxyphosphoribosylaminopyrimidine deaminase/5-amino-6-(5-phosphoribosylamino)uracil reductase
MLAALGQAGLQSVLIEGGAAVLNQFVAANLWDEALIFTAPVHFGPGGIAAPRLVGAQVLQHKKVGVDTLTTYGNIRQGFWARLQVLAPAEGTDTALGYL